MAFITPASPPADTAASISGQVVITSVSGQPVSITNISGASLSTSVSGQSVLVSGNVVNVSGQAVSVSGQTVTAIPASNQNITTVGWVTITALSGGTALSSGNAAGGCLVQSLPSNTGEIFVGGSGANAPFSGKGIMLTAGSAVEFLNIANFNQVRCFATVSGDKVSVVGEG